MTDDGSLTLSIGAVSRATGIPANTLRTWERRYGFPKPMRTEGGQRAYPASVVAHLIEVSRALDRGLRPRDVLTASREDLQRWTLPDAPTAVPDDEIDELLRAIRNLDASGIRRNFEIRWAQVGALAFLDEVAGPLFHRIGDKWVEGTLSIPQEHFASEVLRDFLSQHWRPLADSAKGPMVVCASLPGERHDLGLHFVATTLALAGRRITFLGTDVPIDDIVQVCHSTRPEALAISVSSANVSDATADHLARVRAGIPADVPLLLGGAGAPHTERAIHLGSCQGLDHWARPRA
jgi:DNA-binding transcriptional MerR regulator/methylmalonyl-CoA mutase cobalamin-binding subunit